MGAIYFAIRGQFDPSWMLPNLAQPYRALPFPAVSEGRRALASAGAVVTLDQLRRQPRAAPATKSPPIIMLTSSIHDSDIQQS